MLVLAMIAVAAVVALRPPAGPSYLSQARQAVSPVITANHQLAGKLTALAPAGDSAPVSASVQTTIGIVQSAQRTLGGLRPGSGPDRQFATTATAALASELAWLHAAASVLGKPNSPMLYQLGSLGADTQAKFRALNADMSGAAPSFPGSARLLRYAQAAIASVATKKALTQFNGQVKALLNQSGPSFQQVNQLFGQLETAASGGQPTITLAQAEASITTVISNRTALAASARTLTATTPLAASARGALVAAMDASLTNDQDISRCLNQANTGTVAFIFQSCLTSTAGDSQSATVAKDHFRTLYNRLRHSLGLRPVSQQF